MSRVNDTIRPIVWRDHGLALLDQRRLPERSEWVECADSAAVADAIGRMVVRGAPAIGIAAAYGAVLAAREAYDAQPSAWRPAFEARLDALAAARPTAVNLAWSLARQRRCAAAVGSGDPVPALRAEADAIVAEDIAANRRMGELGAALIPHGTAVLTHCNTGSLATGGYGTALGVIRSAWSQGRLRHVYATETRPWLQGARLTAWELVQDAIPVSLVADGAAAALLRVGQISWVVVGADRVAANGDVANKIGTYALALAARHHDAGFMVVAPASTVDMALDRGDDIPIETRPGEELLNVAGHRLAAAGAEAWNPVFDVTPAALVDVLVTERGVIERPDGRRLRAHFPETVPEDHAGA